MSEGFHTPWILFIGILAAYLAISLMIGGKKAYFEPDPDIKDEESH
jgi:hypothetical protein